LGAIFKEPKYRKFIWTQLFPLNQLLQVPSPAGQHGVISLLAS
jgi:hypothetical protein